MKFFKVASAVVVSALALVSVGGALVFSQAYAQAPAVTPTTVTAPQATPVVPAAPADPAVPSTGPDQAAPQVRAGGKHGGAQDTARTEAQDTALAAALGITLEQLQAGYQQANTAALAEAVTQGLITQAQADAITANGVPTSALHDFGKPGAAAVDYDALLAKALNITAEQLTAARATAEAAQIAAAVAAGTLTQAQADLMKAREALQADANFQANLTAAYKTAVQQAVTDGVITQAQADLILADSANGPAKGGLFGGLDGLGGHGGRGGPQGHGGPNDLGGPNQGTAPQNGTQPSQPNSLDGTSTGTGG
jgi:hypothetical protein